jgi:hypothetical protein
MITGFVGLLGSGKTLGMTAYAKDYHDQGRKILANYHLTFGEIVDPTELIGFEIENVALCLDEAGTLLDSRYNTQAKRYLTYFLKQTRKRDVDVLYNSQRLMDIDIKLRQITDKLVICTKCAGRGFTYHTIEGGVLTDQKWLSIENAKEIFPLYNTKEVIMPVELNLNTSIDHLKEILLDCPNMGSFTALIRTENPYIVKENVEALYSLLKAGKDHLAEKLLRPYRKPTAFSFPPTEARQPKA